MLNAETIQDEWLHEALTKGLKECVTAPILTLDRHHHRRTRRTCGGSTDKRFYDDRYINRLFIV